MKAVTLAAFDAQDAYRTDLGATASSWHRHNLRLDDREARVRVRSATALRTLGATAQALAAGDITAEHVHAITSAVPRLGIATVAEAEQTLLDLARRATPRDVRIAVRRLRQVVDPDETGEARAARQRAGRYLRISEGFDGMVNIDGSLDPAAGSVVRAAIDAFTGPVTAARSEEDGAPLPDDRTRAQRRADALLELAERALATGDAPQVGGVAPHLTLVMDLPTLRHEIDPALGADAALGGVRVDALASSLGPDALDRLCCTAKLTPLVLDGAGVPLALGRSSRLVSSHQLKGLWARDGGCIAPGCDNTRVQAHHIVPWSRGGGTDLAEMCLLCSRHHHLVHDDGWTVEHDPLRPGLMGFLAPGQQPGRRWIPAIHAVDRNPGAKIPLSQLEFPLPDVA